MHFGYILKKVTFVLVYSAKTQNEEENSQIQIVSAYASFSVQSFCIEREYFGRIVAYTFIEIECVSLWVISGVTHFYSSYYPYFYNPNQVLFAGLW